MLIIVYEKIIINMQNVQYIDIKKDENDCFYLRISMANRDTYSVGYCKDEREIREMVKKIESYYKTSQRVCKL